MNDKREPTPENESEIQFDMEGLLSLLAQHLYADPDVFLREMIQNAHDAIVKRQELAWERKEREVPPGAIRIMADEAARTLLISDNGAGLTRSEVREYLSKIGKSGTRELKDRLLKSDRPTALALIGQFGIGVLSAFIVSDRVEITARSPLEPALTWVSAGGAQYRVFSADRAEVGTTVVLHLKSEHSRYLAKDRLRAIVRRYADYIGIPIYIAGEAEPTNRIDAPWHRKYQDASERRDAYVAAWERRFEEEHSLAVLPLLDVPIECPDPTRSGRLLKTFLRGALGITDRHIPDVNTRGTVDVYIARMFVVAGSKELLPPWARFIQGVIDCDGLTPNAARDDVAQNEVLVRVREALGRQILDWLTSLSKEEPKRFAEIMRWHAYHVLAMAVQDEHETFFREVADIVPLQSDQGPLTVKAYLETATKLPNGKKMVHYIAERGSSNQYYLLCKAKKIHVFDASEPFAEQFLQRYAILHTDQVQDQVQLSRLDVAGSDVIFEPIAEDHPDRERFRDLEAAYSAIFPDLRCIARVSRFVPIEMPAVLTESRDQKNRRELEMVADNAALPSFVRDLVKGFLKDKREPLSLHLNADNPTIRRIARRGALRDKVASNALVSLYNNALMLLARHITPDNMKVMFEQYNHVIELMLSLAEESTRLGAEKEALAARLREVEGTSARSDGGLSRCVTCFVAMPFDELHGRVFDALCAVLEDVPYLWQMMRADQEARGGTVWDNVREHMARAHCFIADVSEQKPNVMIEVGRMESFGRPLVLLKRQDSPNLPSDLQGRLHASYAGEQGDALVARLREELGRHPHFLRQQGERRLSPVLLRRSADDLSDAAVKKLAQGFETCEELLAMDAGEAARRLGLSVHTVRLAQDGVRARIGRGGDGREG